MHSWHKPQNIDPLPETFHSEKVLQQFEVTVNTQVS